MVKAAEHDPFTLFAFALRESDWILADLLACFLLLDQPSRDRLARELRRAARLPGKPGSLTDLHRWAQLSRRLEEPESD